jgi:AcrR family transcriptional regulator
VGTEQQAKARPKRSVLAQQRSRETRQSIVRAALELWDERGYEAGFEDTKAEDIAARAGVAKTTFYFHFGGKDDVLMEVAWFTAARFYDDALSIMAGREDIDTVTEQLLARLSARVTRRPRAAVRRILEVQSKPSAPRDATGDLASVSDRFGIQRAFVVIFTHAQEAGEIPTTFSPRSLAEMLTALVMDALCAWATTEDTDLSASLSQRAAILLAGARSVAI